jgi:hypothetical protein
VTKLSTLWFGLGVALAASPLLELEACAPSASSWTADDTKRETDNVHAEMLLEQMCADAAPCHPEAVRALERSVLTNNCAALFAHRQSVPEAGAACAPPP